ncbi:Vacuolar protein-sorting-associated protein [Nymphaea thermarum]|nr:Vacuolar protein-sorting-associated protein [Nymphaea thermarum]
MLCDGDMRTAIELFDQMPRRNLVTWNAMIAGYAKIGEMGVARQLSEGSSDGWSCGYACQMGTQDQQDVQTPHWYQAAGYPPSPSIPSTPNSASSMSTVQQRAPDHSPLPSYGQVSPAEAAGIIGLLKDKSIDELRKILSDKEAYNAVLNSIEQVKIQNNCQIIRTTELAAAQEKLNDLEKEKEETRRLYAPDTLIRKLQGESPWEFAGKESCTFFEKERANGGYCFADAMASADEGSEKLHEQFLSGDIDLQTFLSKYKKQRVIYHQRSLLHLAAKTSL